MKNKKIRKMKKIILSFIALIFTLSINAQLDRSVMPLGGPSPKIKLDKPKEFKLKNGIRVLAGDVILGEEGEFILVETSTSWPTKQHQGNIVFVHDGESWKSSDYDGTMIFDLKADMISKGEFYEVIK